MFVKVVFPINPQVDIFECDNVSYHKSADSEGNPILYVEMMRDSKTITDGMGMRFDSEEVHIFLMNNNGKTIDTILWKNREYI